MRKGKDAEWDIYDPKSGTTQWERVPIAVLMDIRDELKKLNMLLHCNNFTAIPWKLDRIAFNTTPPKPKRKRKKKVIA